MCGGGGWREGGYCLLPPPPTLKWILKEYDGRVWTWFIWLKVPAISRLLWTWCWTCRFQKCKEFLTAELRFQIPTIIPLTVLVRIYLISVHFKRKHNPQYLCWYELIFKSIPFFSEFDLLTWTLSSTNNNKCCSNNQITSVKSTVLRHWNFMDFISYLCQVT